MLRNSRETKILFIMCTVATDVVNKGYHTPNRSLKHERASCVRVNEIDIYKHYVYLSSGDRGAQSA